MNDDRLRERLRAADPARHLIDHPLLEVPEDDMAAHPVGINRGRVLLAAAAAAVVLIAVLGMFLGRDGGRDDSHPPTAAPHPAASPSTTPSPSPTGTPPAARLATYTLAAAPAGARCIPPSPKGIRALDVAFVGRVTDVSRGKVTLRPTSWFAGPRAERVVLAQDAASGHREALPVRFAEGKRYVVAVRDAQVQLCGFTASASTALVALYERSR